MLNTLAALLWILTPILTGPICWFISVYLVLNFEIGKYLIFLYATYIYFDRKTCEQGGRRTTFLRRLNAWKYFRDYFPVKIVKTTELSSDKNYLFAVFPHGILSAGCFAAFGSDSLNFETLFSGLKCYYCTLKLNFFLPFIREVGLWLGMVAASEKSLNWILSHPRKKKAAVLVVGGAAEALYNKPGECRIFLKNRKGFCRVALQNGSPIVPVFSFGETDVYEQVNAKPGSKLHSFQQGFKRLTGVAPVFFFGRFWLMPRQVPITIVVGAPIKVEKVEHPSEQCIDELHNLFMKNILRLFNDHKHEYLKYSDVELIID